MLGGHDWGMHNQERDLMAEEAAEVESAAKPRRGPPQVRTGNMKTPCAPGYGEVAFGVQSPSICRTLD